MVTEQDFVSVDIPYIDNLQDLVTMIRKGEHSHVRVDGKLFVIAARKPSGMASLEEIERINSEFGLTMSLLEYDSAPCIKCGQTITGYDFIKSAVDAHGIRFLSNERMTGFMLRISDSPLPVVCPSCQTINHARDYVDNQMHGALYTCWAYGCCRELSTLVQILKMMESGARAYQRRIASMKL